MPGGRIDIEVGINTGAVPGQLERGMQPALGVAKKVAGAIGLTLGVAGIASVGKQILAIGDTYTNTMNTMSAVSGASASQMAAVGERAKQLGNDIQLPGTSASDAAAAMTELAKGGFSVQQSMDAAKGTLQLAAAAQIDAASAATIQSQALQSFGLNADYAAKTADVLANAANASSAEITDIASGLQQSGAVANQFGMTIEDTAASLGVLANAGIAGSDAGTLIKSALLALTDTSKPAQAAIDDLGLTVYNAQGQFVGMSSLFGQLDEAAANMTPELYQAATATLFGSDAMRLAGVAAEQGSAGFDTMLTAINRQGAAAEVAAAKTKGLPGALETVTNSAESLALGIYELVDGPMESFARGAAEKITSVTPQIVDGFSSVGAVLAPIAEGVGKVVGAFLDLPAPIQAAAVALGAVKAFGVDDKISGWVDTLTEKFQGFREEMEVQQEIAASSATEYNDLGEAIGENAEPLSEMAAGLATLEARVPAIGKMGEAYRGVTDRTTAFATRQRDLAAATGGLTGQLRVGVAQVSRFAGAVGGGAMAAVSGLKTAAGAAVSAFGGPWMLGIMAATMVVAQFSAENQKAAAQQDAMRTGTETVGAAQRDMAKAFQESSGSITDSVRSAVSAQVEAVTAQYDAVADSKPAVVSLNSVIAGFDLMGRSIKVSRGETADAWREQDKLADRAAKVKAAFDALGLTSAEVGDKISGSTNEYQAFIESLKATGDGGAIAAKEMNKLRAEFLVAQSSAKTLTPGFIDLADATKILADSTSDADSRASALKRTLDVLAGIPIPLSDAVQHYNDTIRELASGTSDAWDQTKGWGAALLLQDKSINTSTENGSKLYDSIKEIRDATADAATAGADMGPIYEKNAEAFANLAAKAGISVPEMEAAARAAGYMPEVINSKIALTGADATAQQLDNVRLLMNNIEGDGPKTIEVQVEDQEAQQSLRNLGFTVEAVPGTKNVKVTAPSDIPLASLNAVIAKVVEVGNQEAMPSVDVDLTSFNLGADITRRVLAELDGAKGEPAVVPILDKLKEGKAITLRDLQELNQSSASPEVKAVVAQAITDLQNVKRDVDAIPNSKDVRVNMTTVRTEYWQSRGISAADAPTIQGPVPLPEKANGGRLPAYAGGGRMPSTGPGTSTIDGIYAVTPDGVAIAKVNRKEWIINDKSSDKYNTELAMINAGTFPKLPGFAEGGRLAQDRIEDLGRRMDGVGYVLGGASFAGADCSGYVAMHQRAAMGEDPPVGRLGTTYSLLDGSWPDLVPGSKGPFVVGTSEEHMALTAFGTNYESGGAYGAAKMGGSVGAFDSQFTKQFYLPWELFSPPITNESGSTPSVGVGAMSDSYSSSKKATWTEKDELNLKSAVIAIDQAREAQAKTNADPDKTPADRAQAQTKVEKAEERVRSYEAKRDAAAAGRDAPPAPEAPELGVARTEEQISQRQAERAVDKARLDRNEVYASADSTDRDKEEADDALQSAINALEERGKSTSGSLPSTWSEAFGEIAKEFVSSNVSDVLGFYGASDSLGPLLTSAALIGKAAQNNFGQAPVEPQPNVPISAADAATQLPVTPGIEGWWESMTKALGAKIPLYDTGGVWPSGTPGMNLSGKDELVLTHDQRKQAGQDFALLSSLAAANRMPQQDSSHRAPSGRDAFASQRPIQVTANGFDRREIAEGIRQARHRDEYEAAQVRIN